MLLERDPPINWHEILLDFIRWRWKLKHVAETLNIPPSTLGGWWYDGHEPGHSDGQALLKLHAQESKKRQSVKEPPEKGAKSASRARVHKQEIVMAKRGPKKVNEPGAEPRASGLPAQGPGASDPDAAIAAARSGGTHKVAKARAAVPPSRTKGDPDRPRGMPVNASKDMTYDEAMRLQQAGELKRAVLTEQGWVMPLPRQIPAGARA